MAIDIKFYHSLSTTIGGNIDTSNLVGSQITTGQQAASAGDVSDTIVSEAATGDPTYFYRKLWLKNEGADDVEAPKFYISMATYPGQVSVARCVSPTDTSANNETIPYGYADEDFLSPNSIARAVPVFSDTSDMSAGETAGLWLRIRVPEGMDSDPDAAFRLNVFGRLI